MGFQIGVLGATGFIATPYRQEIREAATDARIVAHCARRRDQLERAAREDGAEFVTDDWRQVVDHPDIDLVLVATPDALHYEAAMRCAEQGKHVFCEKPVGMNTREAREIWQAFRDAELGHFVPYWTRYIEVFARARQMVESGELGEIRGVVWRWHNPRPSAIPFTWRDNADLSAAGSIGDVGSHAYDIVRWITGAEASRVLAHAGVISGPKPDIGEPNLSEALEWGQKHTASDSADQRTGTAFDYGGILVEFRGGAIGAMLASHAPFLRKGLAPDLELHGTKASLAVYRIESTIALAGPGDDPPVREIVPDPGVGNRFARFVFPAVRERAAGAPCKHPGLDDGWHVQRFVDAAATSARRGAWVELEEMDDPNR